MSEPTIPDDTHELTGELRPEVKEKWLAALRSGDYRQARDCLHLVDGPHREDRYCCLGVLCELAVQEGVIPPGHPTDKFGTLIAYSGVTTLPPGQLMDWAYAKHPRADGDHWTVPDEFGTTRGLAQLNDEYGMTFAEIADYIEKNL